MLLLASACKLVPLMLVGMTVHGKQYTNADMMSAAFMTTGVAMYSGTGGARSVAVSWSQSPAASAPLQATNHTDLLSPTPTTMWGLSNTAIGLALVGINLLLDGLMNTGQEHVYRTYHVQPAVFMTWLNFWSAFLQCAAFAADACIRGHASIIGQTFSFVLARPEFVLHVGAFGTCAAIAQVFIYRCILQHGTLWTASVTISRKFASILLSVMLFNHRLSLQQWTGVAAVFIGLFLQVRPFGCQPRSRTAATALCDHSLPAPMLVPPLSGRKTKPARTHGMDSTGSGSNMKPHRRPDHDSKHSDSKLAGHAD